MNQVTTQATAAELRDALAAVEGQIDQLASEYGSAIADGDGDAAAEVESRVGVLDQRARELRSAIEAAERAESLAAERRAQLERAAQEEAERRAAITRQHDRLTRLAARLDAQADIADERAALDRREWAAEAALPYDERIYFIPQARADKQPERALSAALDAIGNGPPALMREAAAALRAEAANL